MCVWALNSARKTQWQMSRQITQKERKEQELTQNSYHHVTGDNQHEQSAAYDVVQLLQTHKTQAHTLHHCFQNKTLFHHKFKRETFLMHDAHPKNKLAKNVLSQDVSASEQMWRSVALHHLLSSEWVPSEWESKHLIKTSQ